MNDIVNYEGFRGVHKNEAEITLKTGTFYKSNGKNEYLGSGIYFFEDDMQEAFNFAKYTRKIKDDNIKVIQVLISTERKKVFDLIHSSVHQDYIKLIQRIEKRYADEKFFPDLPVFEKPYDGGLINFICKQIKYELVRAAFNPNNILGKKLIDNGKTRIPKTHIQLCVRNEKIIDAYDIII